MEYQLYCSPSVLYCTVLNITITYWLLIITYGLVLLVLMFFFYCHFTKAKTSNSISVYYRSHFCFGQEISKGCAIIFSVPQGSTFQTTYTPHTPNHLHSVNFVFYFLNIVMSVTWLDTSRYSSLSQSDYSVSCCFPKLTWVSQTLNPIWQYVTHHNLQSCIRHLWNTKCISDTLPIIYNLKPMFCVLHLSYTVVYLHYMYSSVLLCTVMVLETWHLIPLLYSV